jgi:hypothetical protein
MRVLCKTSKWVALILGLILAIPALAAGPAATPEPVKQGLTKRGGDTPQRQPRGAGSPSRSYRSGGGGHYGGGYHYSGRHYRPYYYYGYGPYYGHYGFGYYPWGYGGGGYALPRYYSGAPLTGAIDLNVHPKKAKVFLNGQFIGKAGKYDGWPQYLWLPEGDYELIFYLDGYETVRKQFEVTPNVTIKTDLTLNSGHTTSVEEMSQALKNRVNEREELRRKYSKDRPGVRDLSEDRNQIEKPDLRELPPRVLVQVTPEDAVLYLDGRFLGTARAIAKRGGEFTVEPGTHDLEVIRPGHQSHRRRFEAERGEVIELDIKLQPEE